jgi:hypothetical protein
MLRPSPREEQHLEPLSETTEEPQECGEFEEELSLDKEHPPDILEQSQSPGQEPIEEELLGDPEHNLVIKEFHFKLESSSEEGPELSTTQCLDNESQQVPNTEQIKELEPEPNPEPREEIKPEMSDRGTPASEGKSKPKWPTPHIYTGEGKDRDP